MSLINRQDHSTSSPQPIPPAPKRSPFKWAVLGVGGVIAIAHLGILGHIMKANQDAMLRMASRPQYPSLNIPTGEYTSYDVNVNRDGYNIRYNANDPKVLRESYLLALFVLVLRLRLHPVVYLPLRQLL